MTKLTRAKVIGISNNTIRLPIVQTDENRNEIKSITYIADIGKADAVGGAGIPEYITLGKENSEGHYIEATYQLIQSDVHAGFDTIVDENLN